MRGISWGVVIGLGGSAVLLAVFAVKNFLTPCEFPGTMQCLFEAETLGHVARLQSYAALGLALVAGGLALFKRKPAQ